jgi:putative phage-type endonuclease
METNEIFERVPYTTKEEWLKLRGKGIGGSDASAIMGYSNWTTNNDLWREKVYGVDKKNEVENEQIIYGKAAEEPLRQLFQAKFVGFLKISTTNEVLVRKDKPYLRASLDAEIGVLKDFIFLSADDEEYMLKKGMRGIWENKTSFMAPKEKWDKRIPMNYYCQILHYFNVTGWDFVIVSVEITLKGGASIIKHFLFLKGQHQDSMKLLDLREDEFWYNVENKIEPPMKIRF